MTPRPTSVVRRRPDWLVVGLGLLLVALSLVATMGDPADAAATAADPASDGSDWGPTGRLSSDSAVTVRWDNAGNAEQSVVPRDQRQVLAHTAGKTYADLSSSVQDAYDAGFGAGNGYGGLAVTVSQTRDLSNQGITLDFTGVNPDLPPGSASSNRYLQVFQCWGAPGPGGAPEVGDTGPDPQTCQVGAPGADTAEASAPRERRIVQGDLLARGGDWDAYTSSSTEVPFRSITGELSGGNLEGRNPFFNTTTTNELSHVIFPVSGATTREFEVQTGTESRGLGCGFRPDAVSTSTCWLVVVPRVIGTHQGLGPIAPSVWAQRLQVPLTFQDLQEGCPSGRARSLVGGSEVLADAAASWTPGLCAADGIAFGYSRLGDEVARRQYVAGSSSAVLTSDPVISREPAVHVPLALTAPVVSLMVDYDPQCSDGTDTERATTEAEARACGYDDLAALRADEAKAGRPITDLRLNARLVAKLLTQSYQSANMVCRANCELAVNEGSQPRWTVERPKTLFADPEFRALNPQLHQRATGGGGEPLVDIVVEGLRSDAAAQVWRWLLADPGAASFLAGCPDPWDVTINPFYSSRTYAGCEFRSTALEREAAADRAATTTPRTYVDGPQTYPPVGSPFPLPGWQEEAGSANQTARTLVDHFPRVDNLQISARNTFAGYRPRLGTWCATEQDPNCLPAPGKWKDPKTPVPPGSRRVLALTDAASAARFRLPTARLCDEDGASCVGADTASLQAAAAGFQPTGTAGVVGPATAADYAGGAYPLTLPVYAAVRPSLPQADRDSYASSFDYITTRGQTPGLAAGQLPPGYAPLTPALREQAASAISALRAGVPVPSASPTAKPSKDPEPTEETPTPTATPSSDSPPPPAQESVPPPAPEVSAPPSAAPAVATPPPGTTTETAMVPAAAGTESWPGYALALGIALALGAGVGGPLLRTRTRWRLR